MYMYRVSYGTRSWWTAIPQVERKEVVKKTAKTVVYKEPVKRYKDGEYKQVRVIENREHLKSDGIKWFDDFESAKAFAVADQEKKLNESVCRVDVLKGNLEELNNLKEGEEV